MEGVLVMGLDSDEMKEILSEHEHKLTDHAEKITELQIKNAGFSERFTSLEGQLGDVKNTLVRMENSSLQSSNILMNSISQIAVNTSYKKLENEKDATRVGSEIIKTKLDNKLNVTLKILAIVGGAISIILVGYFSLKGIHVVSPI